MPTLASIPNRTDDMDTSTFFFTLMAATLCVVTIQAWRLGNERRDVALLGTVGGLCGVGAVVTAMV